MSKRCCYHVAYAYQNVGIHLGLSEIEFDRDRPITTSADLSDVRENICKTRHRDAIVILSWTLFPDEPPEPGGSEG